MNQEIRLEPPRRHAWLDKPISVTSGVGSAPSLMAGAITGRRSGGDWR